MHKISFHDDNHKNLEGGISSRKIKYNRGENPKRQFPGRLTLSIAISFNNDATQPYIWNGKWH